MVAGRGCRIAVLVMTLACVAAAVRAESVPTPSTCLGTVSADDHVIEEIVFPDPEQRSGPALNGMSTLFFLDDDLAWKRTPLVERLEQGGVRALRFPGGEVADNYVWVDNSVEQAGLWPGAAATPEAREKRTDFREFLRYAEQLGARELFFVVNVDGIFRSTDERSAALERYARSAAAWVAAVNAAGPRVGYWEIGNEPYLVNYPLTVKEYAQVLKVFAAEMRSVDPSIRIGAAGPMHIHSVGFADQIDGLALAESRRAPGGVRRLCRGLGRAACAKRLLNGRPQPADVPRWWPTLLSEAGDAFDFAVVHSYALSNVAGGSTPEKFRLTERIKNLKKLLKDAKGYAVPVALTEWNTPNFEGPPADEIEHLMEVTIQLGGFAVAGLDHALYWPMRSPGGHFPAAYDDAGEPTVVGKLLEEIHELINEVEAAQTVVRGTVYAYMARAAGGRGTVLVNRGMDAVTVPLSAIEVPSGSLVRFLSDSDGRAVLAERCEFGAAGGRGDLITLPPRSIAVVRSRVGTE